MSQEISLTEQSETQETFGYDNEEMQKRVSKSYEGFGTYIFVSYASEDRPVVKTIINELMARKYRVWWDEGIKIGRLYADDLYNKVKKAHTLLVFLSAHSLASKHVLNEVGLAFDHDELIIPVWLGDPLPLPGALDYWIRFTQQSRIVLPKSTKDKDAYKEVVEHITTFLPDATKDEAIIEGGVYVSSAETVRDAAFGEDIHTIGNGAFKNRTKLTRISLSPGIRRIGSETFRGCKSINELFIPGTIKYIGDSAFRDCINLKKLTLEKSKLGGIELGERAFENCSALTDIFLPENINEIYSGVFNSCRSLEHINIPQSVTVIGDNAFVSCSALKELNLPGGVARIDDAAFSGCSSLKEVKIPDSVSRLGKNVFKDCINLSQIILGTNITNIDTGCFRGCTNLKSISLSSNSRHFKCVDGVLYNKNKSDLLCYPAGKEDETFEVPDSVVRIRDWAFSDCKNLKEIYIPDTVEVIGEGAFFKCEKLERIVIPESVTAFEDTAFRGCCNLKEVIIESPVISEIGWGIFYGCHEDLVIKSRSKLMAAYCDGKPVKFEELK